MFTENPNFWKGNCGIWTFDSFVKLKMPYIRIHNITVQNGSMLTNLKDISPQSMYYINNCLSIVGFRYVLSVTYSNVSGNILTIQFELNNIGLNSCYFDIYTMYYRIKNNVTSTTQDVEIPVNFKSILPQNSKPGQFAIGNGTLFNLNIDVTGMTSYTVSLIIKDKLFQTPMYLSNYNRQGDGSYLLYSK